MWKMNPAHCTPAAEYFQGAFRKKTDAEALVMEILILAPALP